MPITRPSSDFRDKQNVNPVINRKQEATAEDYAEADAILNEIADVLDIIYDEDYRAEFLGYFSDLATAEATFPNPPENSFVVLMTNNQPTGIGRYTNGNWQETLGEGSIVYQSQPVDFPDTGQPDVWYVATEAKKIYLWYNNDYQLLSEPGQNGLSAYQLAVQYGYQGTEEEFAANTVNTLSYKIQTLTPAQQTQVGKNLSLTEASVPDWASDAENEISF